MLDNKKYIAIVGPTASGKTDMAIKLAKVFNGEIICADSRTIYRGMDIGTAKPKQTELNDIPHYLVDICDPTEEFSAAQFKLRAQECIEAIASKGKIPFLVGGSGMYIDSVIYDYKFRNIQSNKDIASIKSMSLEGLQKMAKEKEPYLFTKIDNKNRRRLEQLLIKGPAKDDDRFNTQPNCLVIGLSIKEPLLKQNIENRTKTMLNKNLIQEVKNLIAQYGECDVFRQTTGYAQVLQHIHGEITKDSLYERIVNATWQLSRKQMTWFRRNKNIVWVNNFKQAQAYIKDYLK